MPALQGFSTTSWLALGYARPGGEVSARDALVGLDVAAPRRLRHLGGQRRWRWVLVPIEALEVVAHRLLVEAGRRGARLPLGGKPGEPDGFLKEGSGNDEFALAYYQPDDIPVTAALTRQFTTFDRYFCSWLGSTYPNREYMHSAQSGGITNNDFPPQRAQTNPEWAAGFDWPTIWTALDAKGVTWKYYYCLLYTSPSPRDS